MVKNCIRGIFHYCLKITKLQTLQNISTMNGEKCCKYYKITDITKYSNIYVRFVNLMWKENYKITNLTSIYTINT